MKNLLQILAFLLPVSACAAPLPVRIEIGDGVFTPQAEVSFRRNLRTLSTPPYTLVMQAPDIEAFAAFTEGRAGQPMQLFVCGEMVFAPDLSAPITNGKISIHNAPEGGRLETFLTQGCP
jgi:hypothetical protein